MNAKAVCINKTSVSSSPSQIKFLRQFLHANQNHVNLVPEIHLVEKKLMKMFSTIFEIVCLFLIDAGFCVHARSYEVKYDVTWFHFHNNVSTRFHSSSMIDLSNVRIDFVRTFFCVRAKRTHVKSLFLHEKNDSIN